MIHILCCLPSNDIYVSVRTEAPNGEKLTGREGFFWKQQYRLFNVKLIHMFAYKV